MPQTLVRIILIVAAFAMGACNVADDQPAIGNSDENNTTANNSCTGESANGCAVDCAGTPGGTATEDDCGVCDDDPSNDCVVDCAGTPGGTATEDACGVCDEDPENDCEIDCAGEPGGASYEDECGVCDAEPQNDCQPDCAGTFGGDAYEDLCGTCDADPTNDCVEDCEGVANGPAELDFCGRCTGGTTGRLPCDIVEIPVVQDATIDSDNAGTNFGSEATVNTESDNSYGLFKFDLGNLADDDVVYNVEFQLTAIDGEARSGDGTTYVEALTSDTWEESAVTWDTQPDGTEAENTGTFDATTATMGNQAFQFSTAQLSGFISRESAGNKIATLRLRSPGYQIRFASKETAQPGAAPLLRVGVVKARETVFEPVAGATIEQNIGNPFASTDRYYVRPEWRFPNETGMLLRFDLSSLPDNAQIERVFLSAMAGSGYAYGGDGTVYTFFVENDGWDEATVTGTELGLENTQTLKPTNIGSWWLWYDRTVVDRLGVNSSLKLVPVIQQEVGGDKLASFYFSSTGYQTEYYLRTDRDPSKRPKLRVLYTLPGQ